MNPPKISLVLLTVILLGPARVSAGTAQPAAAKCVLRLEPEIDCPSCEDGIKRTLVNARGVQSAEIDVLNNRIIVLYDANRINIKALVGRIRVLGYTAQELK